MKKKDKVLFIPLLVKQYPPFGKPLLLELFDKWKGQGNEVENVQAIYDGEHFVTDNGLKIVHEKFIRGWHELPA